MASEGIIQEAARLWFAATPHASRILSFGAHARGEAFVERAPIDRWAEMARLRRVVQPWRIPVDRPDSGASASSTNPREPNERK